MNHNPSFGTVSYGCGMPDILPWCPPEQVPLTSPLYPPLEPHFDLQPRLPSLAEAIEALDEACKPDDHETFRRLAMRLVKKELGK
jgi:hypothetical protein